MHYTGIRCIS